LALHGYAEHVPMAGLAAIIPALEIRPGSAEALRWPGELPRPSLALRRASSPVPSTDEPLAGWNTRVAPFLGLRNLPHLRWSDDDA
jgi:hypothetical protein